MMASGSLGSVPPTESKLSLSTFGDRIAFAMELRGVKKRGEPGCLMPINEFERLAELSPGEGSVNRLRKRTRPSFEKVERIARVLRVSTEWLVSGKGEPPTKELAATKPDRKVVIDPVNALDAVRQTPAYDLASELVKREFDRRAAYTRNEGLPPFDAYMAFLLRLKSNEDLLTEPAGAMRDEVDDPDAPKPNKRAKR